VSRARALGLDVGIISPAEALRICPAMSREGLHGAVHIPGDGYLEPNGITRELARRAARGGAEVATGTRVTAVRLDPRGRVRGVETTAGAIRTECVVNAAGQWAPRVAAMAGVDLPIVPLMHQYLITRPVPGRELPRQTPVVRDPDNLVYVREEVGGYLIGGFEPHPKAWRLDDVPWDFTQRLLPGEWELFEPLLAGAIRRFPAVEKAEILRLVNGPDGFTPDGRYALGPVPGRPGLWVAAGMSINGVAGAGGVGRVMAEWILEGEPSIDVWELNVRRFGAHLRDRGYVAEKAREVYRYYYALRFPSDEDEWGRPRRTSPLLERLLALGAVFGERAGWERALYFAPGGRGRRQGADERTWERPGYWAHVAREHRAVRERVGVLDMTSFGKLDVTGPGALAFLQRLCANDVDRAVGSLVYTQCLNRRGGIECDLTVTRVGASEFRVTTGTASTASDLGWLRLHLPDDGSVEVADVTERHAVLSVWGPDARRTLATVSRADLSAAAFPYLTSRPIDVAGVEVRANRVSFAGELGWELVTPAEGAGRVWEAVMAAGREFGIEPVGYHALNTLRLEKCFYYWGDDIGPSDTPFEANLAFCVRLDKGDFIGRDALLRQRDQGLRRKLVPLVQDGDACVLWGGEAVVAEGRVVGRLRSGGYGHTIGRNVALAYLPLELTRPGTAVAVESFGRLVPAEVRTAPLWDPRGERVRA
jgi:4-methylaminobutanoate oxidase (formaldehyde-forming)